MKESNTSTAKSESITYNGIGGYFANSSAQTKSNAIEILSNPLPKGRGAIKGIDGEFQVNPANGNTSFSIPLPLSPNPNGSIWPLALSYNSGAGRSFFNIGWDIYLPTTQRRTEKQLSRHFNSNNNQGCFHKRFSELLDCSPVAYRIR